VNTNTRQAYILGAIASLLRAPSRPAAIQTILDDSVELSRVDRKAGLHCFASLRKHIKELEKPYIDRYALKAAGLVFDNGRYIASASYVFEDVAFKWNGPDPDKAAAEKAAKAKAAAEKAAQKAADAEAKANRTASQIKLDDLNRKLANLQAKKANAELEANREAERQSRLAETVANIRMLVLPSALLGHKAHATRWVSDRQPARIIETVEEFSVLEYINTLDDADELISLKAAIDARILTLLESELKIAA
jgi:hypothetical protein